VVACKGNEPTEADVAAFEEVVGFRLPAEFREFTLSSLGGLSMVVREEIWPRPRQGEVAPFWAFCYGLRVFGIASTIPEWLDIRVQYRKFSHKGFAGLVPFLQVVGDADRYCFDREGRIVKWYYDLTEEREQVAASFSELLLEEIHALEERRDRKVRGEDKE